jgi:hypothetical protein
MGRLFDVCFVALMSRVYVAVSPLQYYLHEDYVLNFMSCFSFLIATINCRGTDKSMKK